MKNIVKNIGVAVVAAVMSTGAFAQESSEMDGEVDKAVAQVTSLSEEIEVLTKMMKDEDPNLEKRQASFDESFLILENNLELLKRAQNELDDESEGAMTRNGPLIKHMQLFADDVVKFRSGDVNAGKDARKKVKGLKNLPQEIRKEVQDVKNED
ncbi:MAG: hypothetical protein P8H56_08810 [Crocinitomicaceae bacterium]|nr:hypothetical protein [Crocinitomicaceae bacterium]